jgi:acyl-CoA reductase-like NAD-dependent aldehyde dehydrogenase
VRPRIRSQHEQLIVRSPWDDRVVDTVDVPTDDDIDTLLAELPAATRRLTATPQWQRVDALRTTAGRVRHAEDELAELITAQSGKPIKWARREVQRTAETLSFVADAAATTTGSIQSLDISRFGIGRLGAVRRVPRGPVLAITPANSPLNLVAHKVGPAVALGVPVVIKPHERTPRPALRLAELMAPELPPGAVTVTPVDRSTTRRLAAHPGFAVLSFTGGPVGRLLAQANPEKHHVLELGSAAAVIVAADADLGHAAASIASGAFGNAGQSCISTQRLFVHRSVADRFLTLLGAAVGALRVGDPRDPDTDVGPVADPAHAAQLASWIATARSGGAVVATGGGAQGCLVEPTVLTDVPSDHPLWWDEAFGPVLAVTEYDTDAEVVARINGGPHGLHVGLFTHDVGRIFGCWARLRCTGLVVNESSDTRSDALPYGGVAESGSGREGARWALDELSTTRSLIITGLLS